MGSEGGGLGDAELHEYLIKHEKTKPEVVMRRGGSSILHHSATWILHKETRSPRLVCLCFREIWKVYPNKKFHWEKGSSGSSVHLSLPFLLQVGSENHRRRVCFYSWRRNFPSYTVQHSRVSDYVIWIYRFSAAVVFLTELLIDSNMFQFFLTETTNVSANYRNFTFSLKV